MLKLSYFWTLELLSRHVRSLPFDFSRIDSLTAGSGVPSEGVLRFEARVLGPL